MPKPAICFGQGGREKILDEQKPNAKVVRKGRKSSDGSIAASDSWFSFADNDLPHRNSQSKPRPDTPPSGVYPDVCNAVGKVMLQQPRNFLLTAIGTRGDVQPIIVIGQRLQQDGHNVRVAVDPFFKDAVKGAGLRIHF